MPIRHNLPMVLFGPEHVRRYRETGGKEGHDWQGTQTLILTTTGRKSGKPRSTPLIYDRSGDNYLVVASKGGAPKPPTWFLNLEDNPEAEIQVWGKQIKVRARIATPEEKPELWATMSATWPAYDDYQKRTEREIPVVILEPV